MTERFDAIVIGLGGMGSATAYHLARRGQRVLGLEQFDPLHARGSSHGHSRIIRLAYHEHPDYVPLLRRSYELWHDLEHEAGERLLVPTGSLEGGPEDGATFRGALHAAQLHDIPVEVLDAGELRRRYPAYAGFGDDTRVVWQADGGFLLAERTIAAHHAGARAAGADLRFRTAVSEWTATPDGGVRVITAAGVAEADRLVICAGPWTRALVAPLRHHAIPERQVVAWLDPIRPDLFEPERFPVFLVDVEEGSYYGFPTWEGRGFKLGRYHHLREPIDPDSPDRSTTPNDERVLRAFAERYFPHGAGATRALETCIFTNTPDEHFVLDRLPESPQVSVAAACSGHGYKFASVVGEVMADLAIDGATRHDIGFLALGRLVGRDLSDAEVA